MRLFSPNKPRGNWHYESSKYGYDYNNAPYPEINSDLSLLLTVLTKSKILLPTTVNGKELGLAFKNADDLIKELIRDKTLENSPEISITGDTIIYTEKGEEVHTGIFSIDSFRTFQQSFTLTTNSDIWLPMAFDEENHTFVWNLERYGFNYKRLSGILEKVASSFSWENENLSEKILTERGCMQSGFGLFLSRAVIIEAYRQNPNSSFDLDKYIADLP